MNHLISVVIPAYNAEETLKETVGSVLNQTFQNFEIIIIDDGSTDSTAQIANEFVKNDHRCKYVYQKNKGQPSAMNHGIQEATGEYIAFLDSDDLYGNKKLEQQLCAIKNKDNCVAVTQIKRFMLIDGEKKNLTITAPPEYTTSKDYLKVLLNLSSFEMALFTTALVKKSSLEKAGLFDTTLRTARDWDMWLRLSLFCTFVNIQLPLYLYRKHSQSYSLTHSFQRTLSTHMVILNKIQSFASISIKEIKQAKINRYIEHIQTMIYKNKYIDAMKLLMVSCLVGPIYFKKDFYRLICEIIVGSFHKKT